MDAEIDLGPARRGDARAIAEASRDWIETGLGWRWRPDAISRLLTDPESAAVVSRGDGGVSGFGIMSFDWPHSRAHLILLAVSPSLRGQGVGGALLRWLEILGRRGGIGRIALEVRATRPEVIRFYKGFGYREIGREKGYYERREDAVRMESVLCASAGARSSSR